MRWRWKMVGDEEERRTGRGRRKDDEEKGAVAAAVKQAEAATAGNRGKGGYWLIQCPPTLAEELPRRSTKEEITEETFSHGNQPQGQNDGKGKKQVEDGDYPAVPPQMGREQDTDSFNGEQEETANHLMLTVTGTDQDQSHLLYRSNIVDPRKRKLGRTHAEPSNEDQMWLSVGGKKQPYAVSTEDSRLQYLCISKYNFNTILVIILKPTDLYGQGSWYKPGHATPKVLHKCLLKEEDNIHIDSRPTRESYGEMAYIFERVKGPSQNEQLALLKESSDINFQGLSL
nr:hypothetical protein Iba_chr12bCG11920 [Ipomoea batatas]